MRISTKGRYALRLAIDIAAHECDGPVSLREASNRTNISVKYLEQLAGAMVHAGILSSTRGAHGGYRLTGDASHFTAGDVLRASEGSTAPVACLDDGAGICPRRSECETIGFWEGLEKTIDDYVDSVTLRDLVPTAHATATT
ncbi:RrF2 family transcriptional regulator [Curtanaerobium respiraculi]|jgi:Rrf2 family protein|uniref:RrF2 family transcriptional regulator n=1 Tax=Curtanaerobium respiraculi TaxID=2949669 RepID=UPI0024B327A8|nr:Rrf2 family transcriptional regulator [Curtanaerobium respiraculi]